MSKIEKQSEIQITTLDRIIQALGGRLEIIAHMSTKDIVHTQFVRRLAQLFASLNDCILELQGMSHQSLQLQYSLNRLDRFIPHIRVWGVFTTFIVFALLTFFCMQTVVAVWSEGWADLAIFGGLALGMLVVFRGLFVGLIDVLIFARRDMDVVFEGSAVGILVGNQRRYLFLDGVINISKYRGNLWTIQHYNGTVLNLPVSLISAEQMLFIRNAMEYGRTSDGVRAVVERGRTIAYLRRTGGDEE